jgi:outer membrane protein
MAAVAAAMGAPAAADEGNWMVRVRALYMDTANGSDPIPALAVPSDAIHVQSKVIPDIDVTYFWTKNIATELVLTYPQKHDVTITQSALGGPVAIGSFKHLPPTLTVQYHFLPDQTFRPYVGAGVNYTRIMSVDLAVPTVGNLDLSRNSFGGALQAGFDVKLAPNWFLNVDLKKVWIGADVKLGGQKISHVDVDPLLTGIGIGYRF